MENMGTSDAFEKFRLVVKVFLDDANQYMTYALTLQRISLWLSLCLAPCDKSLLIFLRDITQAYTQFTKYIQRKFLWATCLAKFGSNQTTPCG